MEKQCFKCLQAKSLYEFYKHPQMADGHLNKCKDCAKADVRMARQRRIDYYRERDKARNGLPHRVEGRRRYMKTPAGKRVKAKTINNYKKKYPERVFAARKINNAVRDGRIHKPDTCSSCGSNNTIHGHHEDYSKPLEVTWLCPSCHKAVHNEVLAIN